MTAEAGPIRLGCQDGYDWLEAMCSLSDLLSVCPEIVVGKYVAVTAFDSGPLVPTKEESANGWHSQFGIAYSPRVADPGDIPHDNCYDEWYVFNEPTVIGRIAEQQANIFERWQTDDTLFQFVNFHLGLNVEEQKALAGLFWMQIRRIQPEVYVADCQDFVTFVSKNKELFAAARTGLAGLSSD